MCCSLIKRLWKSFLQLNLYKKSSSNEQTLLKERLATRIYVCSLILFVFIMGIIYGTMERTISGIEYSPSYNKFLQLRSKYATTLHCPCSKLGITYDTFVIIHVDFHQVCSSQFIEQQWIDMIFAEHNRSSLPFDDFRLTLSFFWQIIAGFCVISNRTWTDALAGFSSSHTFIPVAVSDDVVRSQVQSTLDDHMNSVRIVLNRNLLAIRRSTSANQMVSALTTNFYLRYPPTDSNETTSPKMSPRVFNDCSCLNVEGCPHSATFTDDFGHLISPPGMIIDCLIMDGTLASTLECYYDRTCLSLLHRLLPMTIQPLSNNSNKNFRMNSTVEMLLNKIMIDEMTNEIRYDLFYSQCNPSHCSFSFIRRFDILLAVTTIFGIFGIVSFGLKLLALIIATKIIQRINPVVIVNNNMLHATSIQSNRWRIFFGNLQILSNHVRQKIINLNIFESQRPRTNSNIFREQLLTRIFIFLIIGLSIAAGIYTFLTVEEQVVTIDKPSVTTYQQLYNDHSDTLRCPCSQSSVLYGAFLSTNFILHQVCSSDFVSPVWLKYLTSFDPIYLPPWADRIFSRDFRSIGAAYFQTLAIFCSLAKNHVKDAQHLFADTLFINDHVLAPPLFIQQTEAIINSFIIDTQNDFSRLFTWIIVTFGNTFLLTGANTNFAVIIQNGSQVFIDDALYHGEATITNGTVGSTFSCQCPKDYVYCYRRILLYTNASNTFEYDRIFDELSIGCTPLHSFLASKFAWWYNEDYLENIQRAYSIVIQSQPSLKVKSLNASVSTKFGDRQLKDLFEEMFIETWISNKTNFHQYYNQCAPIACSYTITQRRNWIVIFLLFIAIYGGIKQILKILVPNICKLIFFFIDWWKDQRAQHGLPSTDLQHNRLFHTVYRSIINTNLYQTTTTTDERTIQQQRTYTWVYVIMLIISLGIIVFYTAIIQRSITKIHIQPSIEDYEYLSSLNLDDLSCPCTFISIPYNNFITELYVNEFHQACSIDVIDLVIWTDVNILVGSGYYKDRDFRKISKSFSKTFNQLCTIAQQSANNDIMIFQTSTMLVKQVMSRNQFNNQINETLQRFQRKMPLEFARTLDLIRTTIQGNALIAAVPSNWKFVLTENNNEIDALFRNEPVDYVNIKRNTSCSCATSHICTMSAQLLMDNVQPFILEDLVLGCNLLETVLLSSLSCFYSMKCINTIRGTLRLFEFHEVYYPVQLHANLTRFNVNDSIETLASEMFIESWTSNVSYERFFNSCAPSICTYKYYYRFDALELLTRFLTVYSGLSLGIKFIVPYLVRMIKKLRNRARIAVL